MANSNPLAPITYGKDFNFFKKQVVNNGSFLTNAHIAITINTSEVTFQLEGAGFVEYSFNGTTVHGDMTSGLNSANLRFQGRKICKIWFRGTGTVRVEAWES